MSANSQPSTSSSKWGSFFQQAVAGVESRLDNILAEEDYNPQQASNANKASKQPVEQSASRSRTSSVKTQANGTSRSPSAARTNDRLQERLARAVVKPHGETSASSTDVPSRTTSPLPAGESRTSEGETAQGVGEGSYEAGEDLHSGPSARPTGHSVDSALLADSEHATQGSEEPYVPELPLSEGTSPNADTADIVLPSSNRDVPEIGVSPPPTEQQTDYDAAMAQLQADHEAAEARWQEELHTYVEKIDALQSKLKYLAKEAADSARNASTSTDPGSLERKISEKDERIANLMEEGQKLSKMELDHRTTIKKLRQYIADNTKSLADAKRKADAAERGLAKAEERAKQGELAERRANTKLNAHSKIEKELETITAERDSHGATITDLKSQLSRAVARADTAERRSKAESVDIESRQVAELKEDLSSAKVERELSEEKLRREIRDLKEAADRERERARLLEVEHRGELSVLESKMESLRARAEEVSSSTTSDAHAKLLRQIETLQSQYAVASENWQGIESSLLSRLAAVEKERDDIARKEEDLRRKLREANLKAKRTEGELETSRDSNQELGRNLDETKQELEILSSKLAKTDDELINAKQDLVRQKESLDATWTQKVEEEKAKWRDRSPHSTRVFSGRTESPVASNQRSEALATLPERPESRRSSVVPRPAAGIDTPPRQSSYSSFSSDLVALRTGANDLPPPAEDTPSTAAGPEEYFNDTVTPATPSAQEALSQPTRGVNDIISAATAGPGPSVQLVERMSATVRRLESERTALKDELALLTTQRDEARQEVVNLMGEVEEKRAGDKRIKELEAAVEQLDQRYQTTLEMLGEKSEQAEEQKADIEDLKKIYRELVESVVK